MKIMDKDASALVPLSKNHYMGRMVINKTLTNMMLDTCGARSMIDRTTAERLGFKVEVATKNKHFGSFYGPGGKVVYYHGRIQGPIEMWLDDEVMLVAPQLKVVDHCEPLLLLGTDVLTNGDKEWQFCYVGIHPTTRLGRLVVANRKGVTKEIPLTSWPKNGLSQHVKG